MMIFLLNSCIYETIVQQKLDRLNKNHFLRSSEGTIYRVHNVFINPASLIIFQNLSLQLLYRVHVKIVMYNLYYEAVRCSAFHFP